SELGVVGTDVPSGAAESALLRQVVPGVPLGRAGLCDRVEAPDLLAGFRVEADDVAAARLRAAAARDADDDHALGYEWPTGDPEVFLPLTYRGLPDHLAVGRVESHEEHVARREVELVA